MGAGRTSTGQRVGLTILRTKDLSKEGRLNLLSQGLTSRDFKPDLTGAPDLVTSPKRATDTSLDSEQIAKSRGPKN